MTETKNKTFVPAGNGYHIIENVDGDLIKGQAVLAWEIEQLTATKQYVSPVTIGSFSDEQYVAISEPSGRINTLDGEEYESLEEYQADLKRRAA